VESDPKPALQRLPMRIAGDAVAPTAMEKVEDRSGGPDRPDDLNTDAVLCNIPRHSEEFRKKARICH